MEIFVSKEVFALDRSRCVLQKVLQPSIITFWGFTLFYSDLGFSYQSVCFHRYHKLALVTAFQH